MLSGLQPQVVSKGSRRDDILQVLCSCDEREVGGSVLNCIILKPCGFVSNFYRKLEHLKAFLAYRKSQ